MRRGVLVLLVAGLALVGSFSPATAQTYGLVETHGSVLSLSHPLSFRGGHFFLEKPALTDTTRVLGIMVQFQPDQDPRTTGTGQFELFAGNPDSVIDAPPHDQAYFKNHLAFLENYYRRVSDGKVIIQSEVLPSVITLSKEMRAYSPQKTDDYAPLAALVDESWRKADSLFPGFEFSRYQCFIIFHAGVGRDINLQELYGFDPTPFDIPSVYMNLGALRAVFGSNYQGVPVGGGRAFITNSMIIPESQSRLIATVGGPRLLELSINGLLAASFGSFLGLPDLFDTRTGRSGIGRFGLMDGQAIFSFNGLFPPEPSAWEKIYLGWVEPIVVSPGSVSLTAKAVGFHDGSRSTIFKVPINAREYFLIENRNRDPDRNGQKVRAILRGQLVEKTFARDTAGFNATDIRAIKGVVIDVEDYDWSLPGGVDRQGTFYDGGILIWHIDENVIEANLATNTVNANPKRRGVDLEEADGSQDIGQIYSDIHPGRGSQSGTALDFWFKGNASPVYKNAFTPQTNPNSLSNSLTNSRVYVTDFSERGPTMSFRVQIGDEVIRPLPGFPIQLPKFGKPAPLMAADLDGDGNDEVVAHVDEDLYAFRSNGRALFSEPQGRILRRVSVLPALFDVNRDGKADIVAGSYSPLGPILKVWKAEDSNLDGEADELITVDSPVFGRNVAIWNARTAPKILVGSEIDLWILSTEGRVESRELLPARSVIAIGADVSAQPEWVAVGPSSAQSSRLIRWSYPEFQVASAAVAGDIDGEGEPEVVFVAYAGDKDGFEVVVLERNPERVYSFPITPRPLPPVTICPPVLGDLDGDGKRDIVLVINDKLYVYNFSGHPLDRFPINLQRGNETPVSYLQGTIVTPVLGDIDSDGSIDIVVATPSGKLIAYDRAGSILNGFPLVTGGIANSTPVLFNAGGKVAIATTSTDGYLYAWQTSATYKKETIVWGSYLRDAQHTAFEGSVLTGKPISPEFFPSNRAYNWPNPVYGGSTQIRYYLNSNAEVKVKIYDLAGEKVAEFSGPGIGGIDNEVQWDVSNVQSGIYIARIEANGSSGHGVALVKIAVVK